LITIDRLEPERLAGVKGLFSDLDGTISTAGKVGPRAFAALWQLHEAGLHLVVVTGRPAGWCDHIARFWPVDAVVGENGGFYFFHDGRRMQRRYLYDDAQRQNFRRRIEAVGEEILRQVPGARIAADQLYREYDLAIDFCEDVTPLPMAQVLRIKEIFEKAGANAKISSIHVNGWYGEFDKLTTMRLYAQERLGTDLDAEREAFVFCGDSPNDEPMFGFFPLSFGMANVRGFLSLMRRRPAFVTTQPCGAGFRQVADLVLRARAHQEAE